jgi:peptidoglycan/LPS O-acetylase OafA/YrhL
VLIHVGRLRAPLIYEWGLTASAVCAVLVVAASAADHGPIARLLSWRPFVAAGTISYGLYLYHLPIVLVLFKYDLPVGTRIALGMLLPLPVAIASWFWLEKPALRRKRRFEPARELA